MSLKGIFSMDNWDFKSQSILTDLPPEDLELLKKEAIEHTYKKGDTIFREGAVPTGIYYIKSGKVKKYKIDKESREQIIYVANSGELIGYHAVLAGDRYADSAATLEESIISFISRDNFLQAIERSPVLSKRLLKTLSHEFTVFANSLALFAQRSVRERLALQLVVLREKYKKDFQEGMAVEISMSREDLASIVGTARENVVRMLSEFKEEGILQTKGRKIIILDVKKLVGIANNK
jgi:CRP-like cAMP-binding protein